MTGQLSVAEMYEKAVDKEVLTQGVLSMSNHKKAVARELKSTGSVLGGDEIDSECRTEDDDH